MAIPEIGFFEFLKLSFFVAVTVVGALNFTESAVYIHFDETPPLWSRLSIAVFRIFNSVLDELLACHDVNIVLSNLTANHKHNFLLNVTTCNGEKNFSSYSWFIDKIPPTAIISSKQNYSNAEKITIDITFSEACI
ncbi:hypothetical protein F3Y22_tig00013040pilonHSYRG00146 [Hibiscus syriacus]|uniref:Uncharacterized protein n=1 Tax=Hibiscus syriacus TaxID=106335 RepID=A0A6A3C1X2_HIBSY|nr:hypothetical protein F3Y22_tig00013040pilonHSYRG00146 [Hibiscus syriacus]